MLAMRDKNQPPQPKASKNQRLHDPTLNYRLLACLKSKKLISKQHRQQTSQQQKPFIDYCIDTLSINENTLSQACSNYFNWPQKKISLDECKKLLSQPNDIPFIKRFNGIISHKKDSYSVTVLISDPNQLKHFDSMQFYLQKKITFTFIEHRLFNHLKNQLINIEQAQSLQSTSNQHFDRHAIFWTQQIIEHAILHQASDIHFECFQQHYQVRIRQDGLLHTIISPPEALSGALHNHLKILAHLDIAEKRLPQDGRFQFKQTDSSTQDCRMSTCPTQFGEKIVLRLLSSQQQQLKINELGFNAQQHDTFLNYIKKPQGLILVTGPTGSGKTRTLYAALNTLNSPQKNISSAEDPIEIQLHGINQVNINPKAGLDFSAIIRCFLRQDPDIIMIGEMRDTETAAIAIRAAQTGHLVFSTLHTNSASDTITRLLNMGIAPYNIASSISLIISQRLLRKLCPSCKKPDNTNKNTFTSSDGCQYCHQGYQGRIGVFECLPITTSLQQRIIKQASSLDISAIKPAKKNSLLKDNAFSLYHQGITSMEEIYRVLAI